MGVPEHQFPKWTRLEKRDFSFGDQLQTHDQHQLVINLNSPSPDTLCVCYFSKNTLVTPFFCCFFFLWRACNLFWYRKRLSPNIFLKIDSAERNPVFSTHSPTIIFDFDVLQDNNRWFRESISSKNGFIHSFIKFLHTTVSSFVCHQV